MEINAFMIFVRFNLFNQTNKHTVKYITTARAHFLCIPF